MVPFGPDQERLALSLAGQAGVAMRNARLREAIENLFEHFVNASVTAIEQRDPVTSGHSGRVASLTVGLAEAVNRTGNGPFGGTFFTDQHLKELRYASLLHDFGKVGVREEVLVKAKKLPVARLELLQQRLRQRQVEVLLAVPAGGLGPGRAFDPELWEARLRGAGGGDPGARRRPGRGATSPRCWPRTRPKAWSAWRPHLHPLGRPARHHPGAGGPGLPGHPPGQPLGHASATRSRTT